MRRRRQRIENRKNNIVVSKKIKTTFTKFVRGLIRKKQMWTTSKITSNEKYQ